MILQILDSEDRIAYQSGLHPSDTEQGLTIADLIGQPISGWVANQPERYRDALTLCRNTSKRQHCDLSINVNGKIHRWLVQLDRFKNYLIVAATSIPVNMEDLSEREQEVLQLLAKHLSSSQIAAQLGISVSTVEKHRSKIRHKLGLKDELSLLRLGDALNENSAFYFDSRTQQLGEIFP